MYPVLLIFMAMHGVWSTWEYQSENWNDLAPLLAENGYDTVFYCAAYGPATDIEGLRECYEACCEYNIAVHAWVVMWKTSQSPDSLVEALENERRFQVPINDDRAAGTWLCPTDSRNVELFSSLCMEIINQVPVEGIHLDYIRFASDRVCFCHRCRQRFSSWMRRSGVNWPEDCYRGGRYHDSFNVWRAGVITSAVQAVRDSLDRLNRAVLLSAAVLPDSEEMDYFAQQWDTWVETGLLDFVVPMNYSREDSEIVSWSSYQLRTAGDVPIYCGLINYRDDYLFSADDISRQQALAEELGFDGWVLFHLSNTAIEMLRNSLNAQSAADCSTVESQ